MRLRWYLAPFAVACSVTAGCRAAPQTAPAPEVVPKYPKPVVKTDMLGATFDSILPFDKPFVLRVSLPDSVDSLVTWYGPYDCIARPEDQRAACGGNYALSTPTPTLPFGEAAISVRALLPNQPYQFAFATWKTSKAGPIHGNRTVTGWTTASFKDHFDTDFGAMYGWRARYTGLGVALHGYWEPIQPKEDLTSVNVPSLTRQWFKRLNLAAGISLAKLSSHTPVDNLYSFGTPFAGVGVRDLPTPDWLPSVVQSAVHSTRFTVGRIWYSQDDANPLVTQKKTKIDWFTSLTFDADVQTALGSLYALLGFK